MKQINLQTCKICFHLIRTKKNKSQEQRVGVNYFNMEGRNIDWMSGITWNYLGLESNIFTKVAEKSDINLYTTHTLNFKRMDTSKMNQFL